MSERLKEHLQLLNCSIRITQKPIETHPENRYAGGIFLPIYLNWDFYVSNHYSNCD